MDIKHKILTLLLFAYSFLVFSQNTETKSFQLNWLDNASVQIGKNKVTTLPIVIHHGIDKNNLPQYSTTINVQNNSIVLSYVLKNIKLETLASNYSKNIDLQIIKNNIESDFQINRARNKSLGILKLTPLIYQNGQIKKLVSFDLEYVLANSLNKTAPVPVFKANSVLNNGTWYKFSIDTTGVFKIDKTFLQQLGIPTAGLNPKNIKIYGNGGGLLPQRNDTFRYDDLQENAILVSGEADGVFNDDDYILFYGKGPESWNIDYSNLSNSKHINNIYSDKAFYFITVDNGIGQRITNASDITQPANQTVTTYHDFLVHEKDETNLFANGQQWLGEDFSNNNQQSFSFDFSEIESTEEITIRLRAAAISYTPTTMNVALNGQSIMDLNFNALSNNSYNLASAKENFTDVLSNQNALTINLTYQNNGNPSAKAYLDFIEIIGTKKLTANGNQFSFRNIASNIPNNIYEYRIANANQVEQVWDISDFIHPKNIANQSTGNDFSFKAFGGEQKNYIVLNENNYFTPEIFDGDAISNQNLHRLKDIDYLIVSPDFLMGEAQRLADYHTQNSNLNTLVVDINQIYNEFGSGSPDLTAIRDFVRYLYYNSTANKKIKYLCLFGDASFDFKDRINGNNNMVPAFQSFESFNLVTSYVTDDYFGMMDPSEGDLSYTDLQDVATGRIPVSTAMEANIAVNKILSYYSTNAFGDWRNLLTFVADDPDNPNEFVLQQAVDNLTKDITTNKPIFNIKKIYADAHQQETTAGGERYPTVNEAISNAVETGTLMVDYFGHGGINGWANERILEVPEIQAWNNPNTLPLFITVTCEFTRFDNPLQPTAGEYTLLNRNGGATNLISTTREIFINVGQNFNSNLIKKLLNYQNENYSIAEALMYAKHDFSSVQRLFIYNLGDPAMKLAYPKPNIQITKINDKDILQSPDTLKALSHIKLEGIVTDENNHILNNYSGTLSTTIYDKPLDKSTLDNDNFGRKMQFTAIESKIFRGRAAINNGAFSFDFIVPKDIRIAYGNAKISLYAENQSEDKGGYNTQIKIGGIDPNAPMDNEGPLISLFMNDESFVDGGNTNQSPVIYAILEDHSGINTSITAVDHDIIAILDGDEANPIILNDYYETELNNYKKGKVKYPLRNLEPGLHTIKFKCWDTYNNPSESALSFIVVDNNNLVLSNVLNYPNPFVNYTEFWFNHNKPNESLEVQVQIFTISGKLIKTLNQSVQSDGLLSREISWNGLDDFGNKIGKGVYIYKLRVKSSFTNTKAEKIEKLVILQ